MRYKVIADMTINGKGRGETIELGEKEAAKRIAKMQVALVQVTFEEEPSEPLFNLVDEEE